MLQRPETEDMSGLKKIIEKKKRVPTIRPMTLCRVDRLFKKIFIQGNVVIVCCLYLKFPIDCLIQANQISLLPVLLFIHSFLT